MHTNLPHIQHGVAKIQRRASHRWAPEVERLIQRRPTFKQSVPEIHIRREESQRDVTPRRPLTRHMSHMSSSSAGGSGGGVTSTARTPQMVLIEKARDAVISTKLRRQKSDLEQEVKLQQAKRRRYAAERLHMAVVGSSEELAAPSEVSRGVSQRRYTSEHLQVSESSEEAVAPVEVSSIHRR